MRLVMHERRRFAKCNGHANRCVALLLEHLHTIAWYGHLRFRDRPLMLVIVVSWLIAFAEYCFQVPANRIGYGEFTAYQLKIIQEIVTLVVFAIFAFLYSGELPRWNYVGSFVCILGAVGFAFWAKFRNLTIAR